MIAMIKLSNVVYFKTAQRNALVALRWALHSFSSSAHALQAKPPWGCVFELQYPIILAKGNVLMHHEKFYAQRFNMVVDGKLAVLNFASLRGGRWRLLDGVVQRRECFA